MNYWVKSLLLGALLAESAPAQLTRGFISGSVADPAGAAMAGVTVTATNSATNLRRETQTNEAGVYRLPAIEPGQYELEFKKTGFDTVRVGGVEVAGAQEVVLDQTLPIAAAVTEIDVHATATGAELSKANATIQVMLPSRLLEDLPTGENPAQLAQLAPGVIRLGRGGNTDAANPASSNGQRPQMNDYTIDGVQNKDLSFYIPTVNVPREAVAEVTVQTQSYSAEFGRSMGAQVSTITRSGSNQFHGMAFAYFDSDKLQPLSLLDKRAGLPPGAYTTWRPGANLGGPILKNHTFFFVHTDVSRSQTDPSARNTPNAVTVPTAEGFAALSGVPLGQGQSAASRQTMLDAIAFLPEIYRTGLALENIRTTSVNGMAIPFGSARVPFGHTDVSPNVIARVDHQLSVRDLITCRILWSAIFMNHSPLTNVLFGTRFSAGSDLTSPNLGLTHTHIFSPTLVNEFRFGRSGARLHFSDPPLGPQTNIAATGIVLGSATGDIDRKSYTYAFQDIATGQRGRHALKAGVEVRWNTWYSLAYSVPVWTFRNFQDFMNNQAASVTWQADRGAQTYAFPNQYYFVQDDWKVRPNLTLALGLRYEYTGLPNGLFGATSPELLAAGIPGPVHPDRNNWAPRMSMAWSPTDTTVLRGGCGLGYDMNIQPRSSAANYPYAITYPVVAPDSYGIYPVTPPAPSTPFTPLAGFTNYDSTLQSPTVHFYNFSVQRQFGTHWVAEAGYLGNRTYHEYRQTQRNYAVLTPDQAQRVRATGNPDTSIPSVQLRRLHPEWGMRTVIESTGIGNYNSAYFRIDRKFARHLLIGASYTYSAALTDVNGAVVNLQSDPPQNVLNNRADYGRSDYDRPHRAVVYYLYETPALSRMPLPVSRVLGSWRVAGSSEWQSGQPFTITTGVDSNGDGTTNNDRPDYNREGALLKDPVTGNLRSFQTALDGTGLFITPLTPNRQPLANSVIGGGNLGRATLRGAGLAIWNVSLSKVIPLTERWCIDLRAEATDLFNHRNFGPPVAVMSNLQFGRNQLDPGRRAVVLNARLRF
jgi:outer membrane receptor protein involved in Fe transport